MHDVDPFLPRPFTVRKVHRENRLVVTLSLTPPGDEPFLFRPGQFNMLYDFGRGDVPISISGDPSRGLFLEHTIAAVGPATRGLDRLKVGQSVGVRGPFGRGWPLEQARGRDLVIVAGGLGLAPVRPVLYEVLEHRCEYGRVVVLYGARSPKDMIFHTELERWRGDLGLDFLVTVDLAQPDWRGRLGPVTSLFRATEGWFDPSRTVTFLCGPEVMMRFTLRELLSRNVAPELIYLSLERNMKCALGFCGHCQWGPHFLCKDGPVFSYREIEPFFAVREL